jgi:PIN domain nuclease of toxin-antitoxin system
MRYLLDSNICVRLALERHKIKPAARSILSSSETVFFYSAVTPWELAIKVAKGKLDLDMDAMMNLLNALSASEIPITSLDGRRAANLPRHHDDPFDRLMIAQAMAQDLTIITSDDDLGAYEVKVVRG